MNKNERITFEKYRRMGIILNKKGWPDHYYFSDGKLTTVETKAPGDDLTFEQQAVRDFLIAHGVRYLVEYVENGVSKTVYDSEIHAHQTDPSHANPNRANPDQARLGQINPVQPNPNQPNPTFRIGYPPSPPTSGASSR